jgi:FKBP-type peptidyl-prolyl cis-trans isomerase
MNKKSFFTAGLTALIVVSVLVFSGCNKGLGKPADGALDKDTSYALGMYLGMYASSQLTPPGIHYDYQSFAEGFKAFTEAEETRFSMDEAIEKLNAWFTEYIAKYQGEQAEINRQAAETNLAAGEAFLLENGRKGGVVTTTSGLQYEVITEGGGPKPVSTDMVRVNYEGTFLDGTVFDSSYERGTPAEFTLNGVISGWTEGIQLMSEGSEYRFFIPANLAYGESGNQGIPPNSVLIFKVELLSVIK